MPRAFVKSGGLTVLLLSLALFCGCRTAPEGNGLSAFSPKSARQTEKKAWRGMSSVLRRIHPPVITGPAYSVWDFGALPDGRTDCLPAFTAAIAEAHRKGGGRVTVPAGEYLLHGPIHLLSGINLHLEDGAYLQFGTNPDDYTPLVKVRWEGTVCYNYSPLIYAYQQENIALTGSGTIDGQSLTFWKDWRARQDPDKAVLRQMGNDLVSEEQRVFGNGFLDLDGDGRDDGYGDGRPHFLRPTMIEFYECRNVLIEGLTLKQSPFWTVHPVFSSNVTIRGLRIYGGFLNDDGIDPDSCADVLIEDCYIETEDDAISIKAGRDQDAWERPGSRNIVVRRCTLNSGVNAFCIGSEMSGGVEEVFVEDCRILSARHGLNFKCNLDRGGQVQRIFLRNIEMDTCREAMFIFRMDYHGYRGNNFPTKFNDFFAGDIRCGFVNGPAFRIVGVAAEPIRRLYIRNVEVTQAQPDVIEHAQEVFIEKKAPGGGSL